MMLLHKRGFLCVLLSVSSVVSIAIEGDVESKCLTSPNYPEDYPNDYNNKQSFSVPQGNIIITFMDFQVEYEYDCSYDFVQFFDGNGVKVGKQMCGVNGLPDDFTIPTSSASVLFHSDESTSQKGFKICYKSAGIVGPALPKCRDKRSDCKKLAKQGFCRSRSTAEINFEYMTETCPKSCGVCGGFPEYLLDQQSCAIVSTIPAHVAEKYQLDSKFYGEDLFSVNTEYGFVDVKTYTGKYTEAYGFPITSSKDVDDRALMRLCYVVRFVYASYKKVRKAAHENKARFVVIGRNEETKDIPAFANFTNTVRGAGGYVTASSEENMLAYATKNAWQGSDIALHEVGHCFHMMGIPKGMPKMYNEIEKAYSSARAAGKYLWKPSGRNGGLKRPKSNAEKYFAKGIPMYARTNDKEYFAQGLNSYVGDTWKHMPPHNAEQLKKYDPTLFGILKKALACNGPEQFIYQHNDIDQVLSRQSRLRINYPDCNLEPGSNIPYEKDVVLKTKEAGVSYTWGRESCSLPWTYEGKTYDGCKKDGIHSWCATNTEDGKFNKDTENHHKGTWGYCQNSDEKLIPRQCSITASGNPCTFPFFYLGLKHETCQGTGWCSTKVDDSKNMLEWSTCDASCFSRLEEEDEEMTLKDMTKK